MANIKIIKRRIKSAQNISQITRAMEMVAASKMKKAQETAMLGKPYAEKIYQAVTELARRIEKEAHPLLSEGNATGKTLVVLISTNKGLCGGLNTNLFKAVHSWWGNEENVEYVSLGKKGASQIARSGGTLVADFSQNQKFVQSVPALTKILVDGFIAGTYGKIYLAFNTFLNALKQMPTRKLILPVGRFEESVAPVDTSSNGALSDFLIEPDVDEVLESLLPHYIENQIRTAINEAEASEHSARMIAMKNATDAAADLTSQLTLIYNKARQEKITYEIADMVTARMAVD